jgi:hypothetical protein
LTWNAHEWTLQPFSPHSAAIEAPALLNVNDRHAEIFLLSMRSETDRLYVLADRIPVSECHEKQLYRSLYTLGDQVKHSIVSHNGRHRVHYRGVEVEQKLELDASQRALNVANLFFGLAPQFNSAEYHLEFLYEWQTYVRLVHLFEKTEAGVSTGYISFTQLPSGEYMVKEKTFAVDGLFREERFVERIPLDDDLGNYLRQHQSHLVTEHKGTFTRWKYDFNVESLRTGHIYSVGFDEVHTLQGAVMKQVEVEYIRSRIHLGDDRTGALIEQDIQALTQHLYHLLQTHGVKCEPTTLSKLSFLKNQTVT